MKGKLLSILFAVLLLIIVFSGCVEELRDTDNDGYKDKEDAFPTDSNLHEKINLMNYSYLMSEDNSNSSFYPENNSFYVESDCKYIEINWTFSGHPLKNVTIRISNHEGDSIYDYFELTERYGKNPVRIPITIQNFGNWDIYFESKTIDIYLINCNVYKVR